MTAFFNPHFLLTALLVSAVIFVNGWTDAPNAVATCIASGAMLPRCAVNMAAVFNLLGATVFFVIGNSLSENVQSSIDSGSDKAPTVLCSAMIAVVAFSVGTWFFGIPTSESHALAAALAGAGLAAGEKTNINLLLLTGLGFLITSAAGLFLGFLFFKFLKKCVPKNSDRDIRRLQILSAALLAFIHGAQDGQKFTAVFLLALRLTLPSSQPSQTAAIFFCALLMSMGTALGGMRIIKKVGNGITAVDSLGGLCCDAAAFISLLFCTLFGLPASTTHTKTTAILGVGIAQRQVNFKTYGSMFAAWILTFPACFAIGYFSVLLCG